MTMAGTISSGLRDIAPREIGNVFHRLVDLLSLGFLLAIGLNPPIEAAEPSSTAKAVLISVQGRVEVLKQGAATWTAATVYQPIENGDRLRTGPHSRAKLRLSSRTVMPVAESTTLTFQKPDSSEKKSILSLDRGALYFRNRERPERFPFRTRTVSGAIRGTEFLVEVTEDGTTRLVMLDGEVDLENEFGGLAVRSGEAARVAPDQPPRRAPALETQRLVQWILYYPAVLDLSDLAAVGEPPPSLAPSMTAYRSGDLLRALDLHPEPEATPESPVEQLYLAALLLSVGQVDHAVDLLDAVDASADPKARDLSRALRRLIAAVLGESHSIAPDSESSPASAWLAESYFRQANGDLPGAREAAQTAVRQLERSADKESTAGVCGFAWVRLAELHFSFARIAPAVEALDHGLELSPRHAQGIALRGFLAAARYHISEAVEYFDRAIKIDSALGNAWLGRGLCRIKSGQPEAGIEDLEVAAVAEPHRAIYRDYLGKAYANKHQNESAEAELDLARRLDPGDPTTWLYLALLEQKKNDVNRAIRHLEHSQELNDNRQVYRSRLLLDRDRAVRGANLAGVYRDADMREVSLREATRAVNRDYANFSAHWFLANSYNELRDPRQKNLRFETPWFSEYLTANLLAPVGAGTLSQEVSQNEYGRFLEENGPGFTSNTEYQSNGDWLQEASQYGTFGKSAYAVDLNYRNENGQQPNNDLDQLTVSTQFKQQITLEDSLYLQAIYYNAEFGDLAQYYNPVDQAHRHFRGREYQEPILLAGYHHEWQPGIHTLALASRLHDRLEIRDPDQAILPLIRDDQGEVAFVPLNFPTAPLDYESEFEAFSLEFLQLWQTDRNTLAAGTRFQIGELDTATALGRSTRFRMVREGNVVPIPFQTDALSVRYSEPLERESVYVYDYWQLVPSLVLSAGLTFDHLEYPRNHRNPPVGRGEDSEDQFSPRLGITWNPLPNTTLRGAVGRALGGVSFDQSFRLEPIQMAGFTQTYRNLISESLVGSIAAPKFTTYGVAWDQRWDSDTYLTVIGELLQSDADQNVGTLEAVDSLPPDFEFTPSPAGTRRSLEYEEKSASVILNQLLGRYLTAGLQYRISESELESQFGGIPTEVSGNFRSNQSALLQQAGAHLLFYHSSGLFTKFEARWTHQHNDLQNQFLPGDDFWQFDLMVGYRFLDRRAEVSVGVLNLTDENYRLNPLTPYAEFRRERTLVTQLRFLF